ncbi:MAG TPA: transketolase [Patescibacteria group bacterium]
MDFPALAEKANEIRETIIKILTNAGTGHPAGALGSADFWTLLYFGGLIKYDAKNPWWEERDRVVLSAGHYCPVLYTVLAEAGFFPKEELMTLRQINSRLQGHPVARCVPGIETSSGPLGQGISQAVGMALAGKMDNKKWKVICFMGDGEQDEGQVWEAYMSASKYKLNNLLIVIDRNNIQIDGHTEDVMPLEPLRDKLQSFGLNVLEIDGHNLEQIEEAFGMAKVNFNKPSVIVLKTIPGKGVDFMENEPSWHGKAPGIGEAVQALNELEEIQTLGGKVIND